MYFRIIILVLLSLLTVSAQDFEPDTMWNINNDAPFTNVTQTEFLTGFEIGDFYSISNLLGNNTHFGSTFHHNFDDSINTTYYPLQYFSFMSNHKNYSFNEVNYGYNPYKPGYSYVSRSMRSHEAAAAIEWEPTLHIPEAERGDYIKNQDNSEHYVFGFSDIFGNINGEYLELDDSITSGTTVLSNPWIKPMMITYQPNEGVFTRDYVGQIWYLSINLKRNANDPNIQDTMTVLEIEIPISYLKENDTTIYSDNIKFNGLPDPTKTIPLCDNGDRGKALGIIDYKDTLYRPTSFKILRNMIPTDGSPITLSAQFYTEGNVMI